MDLFLIFHDLLPLRRLRAICKIKMKNLRFWRLLILSQMVQITYNFLKFIANISKHHTFFLLLIIKKCLIMQNFKIVIFENNLKVTETRVSVNHHKNFKKILLFFPRWQQFRRLILIIRLPDRC